MQETPNHTAQLPWDSDRQEISVKYSARDGIERRVPLFSSAFPLEEGAASVHSGQIAQIGGAWVSGAQLYDVKRANEVEWESDHFNRGDVKYHTSPKRPDNAPLYSGGPDFLVEDAQAAESLASVYCESDLHYAAYRHSRMTAAKLPPHPEKIDRVFISAGPVEHSGRVFTSREDALEDAKIFAAIMDVTKEAQKPAYWNELQDARPTPAFDIEKPGKVDLSKFTQKTSMVQTAYEAGVPTPGLLIAAAALTGAIPADDPRVGALAESERSNMVEDIRGATTDRMDAVRATAAGKVLREKRVEVGTRINALETLETIAVKQGDSKSVGMVLGAAEFELSVPSLNRRRDAERFI